MKRLSEIQKPLHKGKASSEQGSMVVEAALVLPMFMFFVIFLIYIVQMTLISTALQSTVSDTVKIVAAHMYPVSLAVQPMPMVVEQEKAHQAHPIGRFPNCHFLIGFRITATLFLLLFMSG